MNEMLSYTRLFWDTTLCIVSWAQQHSLTAVNAAFKSNSREQAASKKYDSLYLKPNRSAP